MASAAFVKAILFAVAVAMIAAVSAHEAPAPAPGPSAGAAFSLPAATALVGASVLLSIAALFRH